MNKAFSLVEIVSLSVALTLSFIIIPSVTLAQSDLSIPAQLGNIQEQVSIDIEPRVPKPGDQVTISVSAYGTDLNRARITWKYNGSVKLDGTGEKKFTFTEGGVGSINNVNLTITPYNGPAIQKSFSFTPAEVDLLWEANTYTPPFYKGKALLTPEADVNFVAIPNMIAKGTHIKPPNAVYTWKVDYEVQGDKSGYGKDTFFYPGSIIVQPHTIQVQTYAKDDPNVTGLSGVDTNIVSPSALVYENHPLYGVLFNKALTANEFNMDSFEKTLVAYPLNFSTNNKNRDVTYEWTIGDNPVDAPPNQNTLSFQKTQKAKGVSIIGLSIGNSNLDRILQSAQTGLSVLFDNFSAGPSF